MFNIIIVVVSCISVRVAIKICLGTFSFPSFLSKSDSFKLSHKFFSKFEPDNSDNSFELPDNQKDFIHLN